MALSNSIVIVDDLVVLVFRYDVRENEMNDALLCLVSHRPKLLQDVYGACPHGRLRALRRTSVGEDGRAT